MPQRPLQTRKDLSACFKLAKYEVFLEGKTDFKAYADSSEQIHQVKRSAARNS